MLTIIKYLITNPINKERLQLPKVKKNYNLKLEEKFPKIPWFYKIPYMNRIYITSIIKMRTAPCLMGTDLHKWEVSNLHIVNVVV